MHFQMAVNLIQDRSPAELKKEITGIVEKDLRALPGTAKIFAAVARLQEFDRLPEMADPERINQFHHGRLQRTPKGNLALRWSARRTLCP